MSLGNLIRARLEVLLSAAAHFVSRFRRWRLFIPVVVTVPVLAISGALGGYAVWDVTRVDVPDVVGAPWPAGIAALGSLGLGIDEGEGSDVTIAKRCYVVSAQGVPGGTRVVPEDTVIALTVETDSRPVPDVVGLSVADARALLEDGCFHDEILPTWCVPEGFSGGKEMLTSEEFEAETGFIYDVTANLLIDAQLEPDDDWIVCDQVQAASTMKESSSKVGLAITVPLTTVPSLLGSELGQAQIALQETADGCALDYQVTATFTPDPGKIHGKALPSSAETDSWKVLNLQPAVGRPALCGSTVAVGVEWPSATMPKLVGLHHVPEEPSTSTGAGIEAETGAATPATAALEKARLKSSCSGRGTVTSQVPDAGVSMPRGATVTCVAELVVPNIVGLDETTANAVLANAGIEGFGSGSGVVVSQSLIAGSIASSMQSMRFEAKQPQPVYAPRSYYKNCTAARNAGVTPLYQGDAGYGTHLDRDRDGIACE